MAEPDLPPAARRAAAHVLLALTVASLAAAAAAPLPLATRLVLAGAAGAWAVARWALRRQEAARARSERNRRRLALVTRAALDLQQLRSPQDVYEEVPSLLVETFACRAARAVVPHGDGLRVLAAAGDPGASDADDAPPSPIVSRAIRERRLQYEEGAHDARGRPVSSLALPLYADDRLLAALEVRRDGAEAFGRRDREVIEAVGRLAEEALTRLAATDALRRRQRASDALARMSERLLLAPDQPTAAETALRNVLDLSDAAAAAVLRIEGDRLRPIARLGEETPEAAAALDAGLPYAESALRRAWQDGRAVYASDADEEALAEPGPAAVAAHGAIVPVADASGATRALLAIARPAASGPSPSAHRSLFSSVATALGATLQRLQLEHQRHELLDVVRGLAGSEDPEELYGLAVEAAVRLIPGADAASILVRRGDDFHFAAGHGFPEATLRAVGSFSYDDQLAWYGLGREAFVRGVPRRLRGPEVVTVTEASATPEQVAALMEGGRVTEIRATVTVPIVAGRDVLGMLNVDSFSLEDAFGEAELDLAEAFGQHVGVIIRQTQAREALARAAVTDPVTGLGNREGFNRRLELDLARARRREEPVHLVMMDLDDFKRINDQLGHATGDLALQQVARALREGLREEDGLFRWGGDEFALILSGVDAEEARGAALRHATAVSRVEVAGLRMSLSTGIASYPRDGADAPELLRRADDLMYRHKHRADVSAGEER